MQLSTHGRTMDTFRPGGVFRRNGGDLANAWDRRHARSATATAVTDCMAYAMDPARAEFSLKFAPDFALMMMSVMFDRLRLLAARLTHRPDTAEHHSKPGEAIFDDSTVQALQAPCADPSATVRFAENAHHAGRRNG